MLDLKPGYFRGSKFLRYNKKLIVCDNTNIEYDLFIAARKIIFSQYLNGYNRIYELGCGSCQNIFMLAEMFPFARIIGLDWVEPSVAIASLLAKNLNRDITGKIFDMMNPPTDMKIDAGSAIVTIHALEQLDNNFDKLLSYIISAKPGIVIHYEPVLEFYDQDNLLDYLAFSYSRKRKYLCGFWPVLHKLQGDGKIEIIAARRPYLGGVIHEASLIVWRPR
jgi:SAM-dependent methyltransferase